MSGNIPLSTEMTKEKAVKFLDEAARYFDKRPTGGEDRAFWSNVYNAENCRKISEFIKGSEE